MTSATWRKPEQHKQPRTGNAVGTRTRVEARAITVKQQPQGDNTSPS